MFTQKLSPDRATLVSLLETDSKPTEENKKDMETILKEVCETVAPVWPLANFIAVNPLQGFESKKFSEAIGIARKLYHAKGAPDLGFFHQQFRSGRITTRDLVDSLNSFGPVVSVENLMKVLVEEASQDQLPETKAEHSQIYLLLSEWSDQLLGTKLYPLMQAEVSKWSSAYFDRGEAAWRMPERSRGFFHAWMALMEFDKSAELAGLVGFRDYVNSLPKKNTKAIEKMLQDLGVPVTQMADYLVRHLAASPGWAGLFVLKGSEDQFYRGKEKFEPLLDYLAVRLTYDAVGALCSFASRESALKPWEEMLGLAKSKLPSGDENQKKAPSVSMIWLEAFERNYRNQLLDQLGTSARSRKSYEQANLERPKAQTVFCIDVRSEAFRRHLELQGNFDTYGFAGFFAIPLAHQALGDEEPSSQCPVLIRPKYLVSEGPVEGSVHEAEKVLNHKDSVRALENSLHEVKNTSVSPFALVETFGGVGFFQMTLRSFAPKVKEVFQKFFSNLFEPRVKTVPNLTPKGQSAHAHFKIGIPMEDQITIAENSLKIMGLLKNFGRLVLLCGHGSTTTNNAYASALDCGACGGHRGAPNARVAAQLFNDQKVRNALELRGISVPTDTIFVAGEHNTSTDEITLIDEEIIPSSHAADVANLKLALKNAGESLNLERTQRFDNPRKTSQEARQEVERRSRDWSEARPEWGLAGNAAFIVANRSLTKNLDLKGRTFLHSYNWEADSASAALEVIMTAPMVVAEWINTQYYFSTVDNEVFGSGSKVIHNVVGKLGVMQGNISDLKIGLPLQSVSNGSEWVHEPMRLLVVIEAPKERVASIIQKHDSVKKLVVNEWIRLVVLDPSEQRFYRFSPKMEWEIEKLPDSSQIIPQNPHWVH